jgi:hypothetical protein
LDQAVPDPTDVLAQQRGSELLDPRWRFVERTVIVSRSGSVSTSTFGIRP